MGVLLSAFNVPETVPKNLGSQYKEAIHKISRTPNGKKLIPFLKDFICYEWSHDEDIFSADTLQALQESKAPDEIKTAFVKCLAIQNGVYNYFLFEGGNNIFVMRPTRWEQFFHSVCIHIEKKFNEELPNWSDSIGAPRPPS